MRSTGLLRRTWTTPRNGEVPEGNLPEASAPAGNMRAGLRGRVEIASGEFALAGFGGTDPGLGWFGAL